MNNNTLPGSKLVLPSDGPALGCGVKPRIARGVFGGWGPRVMSLAMAGTALAATTHRGDAETTRAHAVCSATLRPPMLAAVQSKGWPTNDASSNRDEGIVSVSVLLDSNADVAATSIAHSSGNFALDQEARRLIAAAKFVPRDGACASIPGSYVLEVDFDES